MDLGLKNKIALVMGSSTGIGRGIAEILIQEGARVALCARNKDRLEQTAQEIGAALAIPCDLSKPKAGQELVQTVEAQLGSIDILVTNTGGPPAGTFAQISHEQWQKGFQSLWMSVVDSAQSVLPSMIERQWGRIILITSSAAKEPLAGLTVSNGLRSGLLGLVKSLSHEMAPHGITVNTVLPGYVDTDRLKELGKSRTELLASVPAGRLGTPQEIGSIVAFLASHQGAYITGQAITADGGRHRGL